VAELGRSFIFELSEGESHSGVLFDGFSIESSGGLQFQSVGSFDGSLVDGGSVFSILSLSFTGGDIDIEGIDFMDLEFVFLDFLVISGLVDNGGVSIKQVLFKFVGEDTFKWGTLVSFSSLSDDISNIVVSISWLNSSQRSLDSIIGSEDDISFSAFNGLASGDNDSVGNLGNETVNVDTEVNLDEVTCLKFNGFRSEGREMSADFVGGDTGGESNTFLHLLLAIDLSAFAFDFLITELAEINDVSINDSLSDDSFKDSVGDFACSLVFVEDTGGSQGFFLREIVFHFVDS